jgi:hypothetical protein
MGTQNVTLSSGGGAPSVEILIGQAQHGTYRVYLWDPNGQNPILIGSGTNWDQILDSINLDPLPALNQKIITWEILVSSGQTGPGQFYSASVMLRQGPSPVQGGVVNEAGQLEGTKFIYGAARLLVA